MRNTISLLIQKRDLFLLFIMNIVFALSIQLVTSLQTLFIESLGANALEIGIVISAQGFVSALFTIPISLITKKIGEKLLLLISAILAIVTPIMYIFAKSWQSLLPWVMIYGVIFSTFVVTRMSLIAAYSTPQNRATIYSVFNITWSIGSLFGPLMAGLLADLYGWNALFSVASLISFFIHSFCSIYERIFKER